MRYPLQSVLGFATVGGGDAADPTAPLCPGACSSPRSGLCPAATERGAEPLSLLARQRFSPAPDRLCPLGLAAAGPQGGGRVARCCGTQSWLPVLGEDGADPDPVPSTSCLPSLGRDPLVWGWSHLLIPLCLLALAQSLFSWFNLVLSAQYVTVEQLSGILRASAASPPGCAPPAPSSSVCTAPALPPPPPSLSSPSGSAEVRAPSLSLCLAISLGGDGDARDRVSPSLPARCLRST